MEDAWLADLFKSHDPIDVEALIATFLLSFGFDTKTTPPALLGVVENFAVRAGVDAEDTFEAAQAKIKAHLAKTPLHPKLRVDFERGIRELLAVKDTGALIQTFARFAEQDLKKRAFDGKRPEGTRPGYLALLAHDDLD